MTAAQNLEPERQVQKSSASGRPPTFGRYAETPLDAMTAAQRAAYDILATVEGDGKPELPGPLKIWVDNGPLGEAIAPLATHFRPPHHSLTAREREIAVCVITGKWHAPYSIDAHSAILKSLGVSGEITTALATGLPARFDDAHEQLVYELAHAVTSSRWVPMDLYDRAVHILGHDRITDVLVLMGFYTAISLTLAFYDVPAGQAGLDR